MFWQCCINDFKAFFIINVRKRISVINKFDQIFASLGINHPILKHFPVN